MNYATNENAKYIHVAVVDESVESLMKTFEDFPEVVFHLRDGNAWRTYYSVATFVEASMNGYAGRLSIATRNGKTNIDVSSLAESIDRAEKRRQTEAYKNADYKNPLWHKEFKDGAKDVKLEWIAKTQAIIEGP